MRVLFVLLSCLTALHQLEGADDWEAIKKIWTLEHGPEKIREYRAGKRSDQELEQLIVSFDQAPKVTVIIPKHKKIWDTQEKRFLSLPRNITLQIYNRPDPQNFFFIVEDSNKKKDQFRYQTYSEDILPIRPIDDLSSNPSSFKTYPKVPFITEKVSAQFSFQGSVAYGQKSFNAPTILGKSELNPHLFEGEVRILFRGLLPLQTGVAGLYHRSILTDTQKYFGESSTYLGPSLRYPFPLWGQSKKIFARLEVLKSLSHTLKRKDTLYEFNNYLMQLGIDYQSMNIPFDTMIGLTVFQEWYNLDSERAGRPSDYGLTATGITLSLGISWDWI